MACLETKRIRKVILPITVLACMVLMRKYPSIFSRELEINSSGARPSQVTDEHIREADQSGEMVRMVCERVENSEYPTTPIYPVGQSRQKGLLDHYHRIVYCDIGKVGSTSWRKFFKKLTAKEKAERSSWRSKHPNVSCDIAPSGDWKEMQELGVCFNHLSRGNDTDIKRKDPITDYYKFVIVRHPLERIASAYIDKVRGRGREHSLNIIRKALNKKKKESHNANSHLSFEDFLSYLTTSEVDMTHLNFHWVTYNTKCDPCGVKYDYIAHLETIKNDLTHLLPIMNATSMLNMFPEANTGDVDKRKYRGMYKNIPSTILEPLVQKYSVDADMFGYSLDDYLSGT